LRSTSKTSKAVAAPTGRRGAARALKNPGPGRPTANRVEAINRAIFVAARAEFDSKGFDAARMETIAAVAGISKGTLYGRYPTKQDLLRAVTAACVVAWSEDWEPDGGPIPMDLRARLKHRAHRLMEDFCSGRIELLERLFTSGQSMDELRRMRYEVGHKRTIAVIAQDIIDGTRDRTIQPRSAVKLAEMLMGMLYGWWRMHQEGRKVTRDEARDFVDDAVDILMDGRAAWGPHRS
jgi:AcrR family transcriptional regulator